MTQEISRPYGENSSLMLSMLWQVYRVRESLGRDFPRGECIYTSADVEGLGLGLRVMGGFFRIDTVVRKLPHSWNENDSGIIVDLTVGQFRDWVSDPIPPGPLIITPDNPLYQRYEKRLEKIRDGYKFVR